MSIQISVIITVLNEANNIGTWIESLTQQTSLPAELIICDGGSTDGTAKIIDQWTERAPFPITRIDSPGANISTGRNIAFRHARHDWIAVTDAGTNLRRDWLARLAANVNGADVVSGFFQPSGTKPFERLLAVTIIPRLEEIDPDRFLPSSRSLLIRRSAWEQVGGYPEWLDYCEDLVFDITLKKTGYVFIFAKDAIVEWTARDSLKSFFKQYYRYARGDGKANLWTKRHLVRYFSYAIGVAGVALSGRFILLLPLLALGFVAYMWKFSKRIIQSEILSTTEKAKGMLLLPIITVVGDVAKMLGYPRGVAWRRNRARRIT